MDDTVVLPSQSEAIFDALKERGKEVKFILFQGEGHDTAQKRNENIGAGQVEGFQARWVQADHIKEGLEAEYNWYRDRIGVSKTGTEL